MILLVFVTSCFSQNSKKYNKEDFIYTDVQNNFEVLVKANSYSNSKKKQYSVISTDSTYISYFVFNGMDDEIYKSLAKHWEQRRKSTNETYTLKSIRDTTIDYQRIEYSEISLTQNDIEFIGLNKTIQFGKSIYIFEIMTRKETYNKDQIKKMEEIRNSFKLIKVK